MPRGRVWLWTWRTHVRSLTPIWRDRVRLAMHPETEGLVGPVLVVGCPGSGRLAVGTHLVDRPVASQDEHAPVGRSQLASLEAVCSLAGSPRGSCGASLSGMAGGLLVIASCPAPPTGRSRCLRDGLLRLLRLLRFRWPLRVCRPQSHLLVARIGRPARRHETDSDPRSRSAISQA